MVERAGGRGGQAVSVSAVGAPAKAGTSDFLFVSGLILGGFCAALIVVAGNGKLMLAFAAPVVVVGLVAVWKMPILTKR